MRSDGQVLPDLRETAVLHDLGLLGSDEIPGLAARWLAADLVDSEPIRMLAGHDAHDPWGIEELLAASIAEAAIGLPSGEAERQQVAVVWVTANWRQSRDTRNAVRTLARLGETYPEFDLGLFIGLDDEWNGGWGRLDADLRADAELEIDSFLHGQA